MGYNELGVFQEAYFGKTPILLECEKILEQMKIEYDRKPSIDMTNHPLNRKLQLLFKKQFGFRDIFIHWHKHHNVDPQLSTHTNCATLLSSFTIFDKDTGNYSTYREPGKGYYDIKHKCVVSIEISYFFFILKQYTAGEILAILLHEIGHNFDRSPYNAFHNILYAITVFENYTLVSKQFKMYQNGYRDPAFVRIFRNNVLTTVGQTISGTRPFKYAMAFVNQTIDKIIDTVPFLSDLEHLGINILRIKEQLELMDPREFLETMKDIRNAVKANPLLLPQKWIRDIPTKKMEIFADSFAQAYGYGPEFASAIQKGDTDEWVEFKKIIEMFPLLAIIADLRLAKVYVVNTIIGPEHGTSVERSKTILKNLKQELVRADGNPELKRQIEADILETEKILQAYMNKTVDNRMYISAAMQWFMVNICGGNTFFLERMFPDSLA